MSLRSDLKRTRSALRSTYLKLRSVDIRQAARKVFDALQFGEGNGFRILSAFVLSAPFLLGLLAVSRIAGLSTIQGLSVAVSSYVVAVAASILLVLWGSDQSLQGSRQALTEQLAKQRGDLREIQAEAEAERQAEAEERHRE